MNNKSLSSPDLEDAIISYFIQESNGYNLKGRNIIKSNDFFVSVNQIIFQAMEDTAEKNLDIELSAIIHELKSSSKFNDQINEHINTLLNLSTLPSNVDKYIKEIVDKAEMRRVKEELINIVNTMPEINDADELLSQIQNKTFSVVSQSKGKDFEHANDIVERAIEKISQRALQDGIAGLSTGFSDLDYITSGWQNGDLVILAARPSMGKTAFALNLAVNAAKENNVAFFSLEMSSEQLVNRILSDKSGISQQLLKEPKKIKNTNDWKKLEIAKSQIKKLKLYINDSGDVNISDLKWKIKKLAKTLNLELVIIDYLQLLSGDSKKSLQNRQNEIAEISRNLKMLAKDLNIPIIALSQLSRGVESREDKRPKMADIRESGAIEQDADLIAFLYRDSYYNKKKYTEEDEHQDTNNEITEFIIAKHRNGPIDTIKFVFKPEVGRFIGLGEKK